MAIVTGPTVRLSNVVTTAGSDPKVFLRALGNDTTLISLHPEGWAMLCALRNGMQTDRVLPALKQWIERTIQSGLPVAENQPINFAEGIAEEQLSEFPDDPLTLAAQLGQNEAIAHIPVLFGGVFSLQGGTPVVVPWDTRLMEPVERLTMFPMVIRQHTSDGKFVSPMPLTWSVMKRALQGSMIPLEGGLGGFDEWTSRSGGKCFTSQGGDGQKMAMTATSHLIEHDFEQTFASQVSYPKRGTLWTRTQRGLMHNLMRDGTLSISHWLHTDLQRTTDGTPDTTVAQFYFIPGGVLEVYLPTGTKHINDFQSANFWALGWAAVEVLRGEASIDDIEVVGEGQVRELKNDERGRYLYANLVSEQEAGMNGVFTGRSYVPVNEEITASWEVTMLQGPKVRFWPLNETTSEATRRHIVKQTKVPASLLGKVSLSLV